MHISSMKTAMKGIESPFKPSVGGDQSEDFGKLLMDVMKETNRVQNESQDLQNAYMTGQPVEVHDLMIAMEKASTSMQLTLQVRNKLLEAYSEIMRTQI